MPGAHRILCNIDHTSAGDWTGWSVHFIDTATNTRMGPWLLIDTAELDTILRWGHLQDWDDHQQAMRSWHRNSASLWLAEDERRQLIERGRNWPWNGYQLRQMMEAGRYPKRPSASATPSVPGSAGQLRAAS